MKEGIIIFIRRFAELIFTSIIISGFITLLNKMEILAQRGHLILGLMIGAVIFFAFNIRMLRNCYYDMGRYHMEYYIINTAAYLLFAAVCYLVYIFCSDEVYTWLFAITKWVRFTVNRIEIYLSALLFHLVGLATVFLSPAGVVTDDFDRR